MFSTDSFFSDTLTDVIRGIIIYEKRYNYLSNVEIYIGDRKMYTEVNELGQFKLEIPDSLKTDTIYLTMEARTNINYTFYFQDYFTVFLRLEEKNFLYVLNEPEPLAGASVTLVPKIKINIQEDTSKMLAPALGIKILQPKN